MLALRRLPFLLIWLILPPAWALDWRPGDVLLQPVVCGLCQLIEAEERTPFAHMGVIIRGGADPLVAEAWGQVRVVSLRQFLSKGDPTREVWGMRLKEMMTANLELAVIPLKGADYDSAFLWDNLGHDGREAFYCSELVTKLLNPFLQHKIVTKPMHYEEARSSWENYFNGHPPDGLPGNSPGDFQRSNLFRPIAYYRDGLWTSR